MKQFDFIQVKKPQTNLFDLGHEKKLTAQMGKLIPIFLQECVPGDTFINKTEIFMRLSPMIAPVMHRVNVYTHFFKVPYRLIWNEFEDFITGGKDGTATPAPPMINMKNANKAAFYKGTLSDYLGLPTPNAGTTINHEYSVSAMPFRAYQMIYNEYYRDQNLSNEIDFSLASGTMNDADITKLVTLRSRAWEKDYFTSCLPWAQRGNPVNLPLSATVTPSYKSTSDVKRYDGASVSGTFAVAGSNLTVGGATSRIENLAASLNVAFNGPTINALRAAIRLQEFLEKNARGGSRYIENILHQFGIKSSDARLQRPEYLGGGKSPIVISEVLQTADTANGPVGDMAGHGISVGTSHSFKTFCEEHSYIIGIMSVLPRTAYQQGIHRRWTRLTREDLYWPVFAQLGEQEVLDKEVYADFSAAGSTTFGYQSRYAEYKYEQDSVHGDFRDTMDFWHMGRKFTSKPSLNETFVMADPTQRVFAVTDPNVHKLYVQVYNDCKAIRPMPVFNVPTL